MCPDCEDTGTVETTESSPGSPYGYLFGSHFCDCERGRAKRQARDDARLEAYLEERESYR